MEVRSAWVSECANGDREASDDGVVGEGDEDEKIGRRGNGQKCDHKVEHDARSAADRDQGRGDRDQGCGVDRDPHSHSATDRDQACVDRIKAMEVIVIQIILIGIKAVVFIVLVLLIGISVVLESW
ncbi:hypothetical protein AMTRI_Chr08g206480 [Amborella trichopoda]